MNQNNLRKCLNKLFGFLRQLKNLQSKNKNKNKSASEYSVHHNSNFCCHPSENVTFLLDDINLSVMSLQFVQNM